MPNEKANNKKEKLLCVDNLRHAEYYEMQGVFDDLYARSKCGEEFTNLMSLILAVKTFSWRIGTSRPMQGVKPLEQMGLP